jgi:hypothetical protein
MTLHWHVMDHYTGDERDYTDRKLMRQWVRRHGGEGIAEIVECDEPECAPQPVSGFRAGAGEGS